MNLGSLVTSVNRKSRHDVVSPPGVQGRSGWPGQAVAVGGGAGGLARSKQSFTPADGRVGPGKGGFTRSNSFPCIYYTWFVWWGVFFAFGFVFFFLLLVGAFNPFTFKVIIDMYVPIPIFLNVLGLLL